MASPFGDPNRFLEGLIHVCHVVDEVRGVVPVVILSGRKDKPPNRISRQGERLKECKAETYEGQGSQNYIHHYIAGANLAATVSQWAHWCIQGYRVGDPSTAEAPYARSRLVRLLGESERLDLRGRV